MVECNHQFQPHPNHDYLRCTSCGATLDDAIDTLLEEASDLLDPSQPGTATERQGQAMRALVRAMRMERGMG